TRKDIEKHITSGASSKTGPTSDMVQSEEPPSYKTEQPSTSSAPDVKASSGDVEIPVKGVRKVIADNMVKSTTEIPHARLTVEVDVTELVAYRNAIKRSEERRVG